MSDAYSFLPSIFSDDPRTGTLTYDQLKARRQIALALATRNRPYPKTIGEGLTALGEGLGEGFANASLARAEAAQTAADAAALRPPSGAVAPPPPSVAPAVPRAPVVPRTAPISTADIDNLDPADIEAARKSSTPEGARRSLIMASATADTTPLTPQQADEQPKMPIEEWLRRIARNETGGHSNPYLAIGQQSRRGDYPYGKYQIMGDNIPAWTKKYLGRSMTPQEFLASPDAQEQVARGQGSEYVAKYGPVGAAGAWFAGEKGMNDPNRKDTLGTAVIDYRRKFANPLTSRTDIAASVTGAQEDPESATPYRVASLGDTAPNVRDDVARTLAGPQPQQVAQAAPVPAPAPQQQLQIFGPTLAQGGPRVPDFPAYGPEPKPPQPTADMIHYRRVAADPYRSDQTRATAMQIYTEMKAAQDAQFNREYELWKSNELKHRDYLVGKEKAQQDLTNAWLEGLKKPQDIIQAPTGAPQAQPQQQSGPDPRLGTPQSPQRTGVPNLPPVPPGTSPAKWSELQAPEASKALVAVEKAVPAFDEMIKTLRLARDHPGREWGVGVTSEIAKRTPGTSAYGFGKIMEQIGGKNFLVAYQQLKGGGAITEIEGTKAEAAQARLATAQTKEDWDKAMNDFELAVRRDLELAQRKVNQPVTAWRAPGDNASYAPDIGERRGDKEYVGGNPADPTSWRKVQ